MMHSRKRVQLFILVPGEFRSIKSQVRFQPDRTPEVTVTIEVIATKFPDNDNQKLSTASKHL